MGKRPRSRRVAALSGGLWIIFSLAGGACAARQAPAVAARSPEGTDPLPTIETTDARLAAALAALKSSETAGTLSHAADQYLRLGVFDRAVGLLGRAIQSEPGDPALLDARARAWRDWGHPELGLGDAHRSVFLAPRSAAAHNTLGTIQFALGLVNDAAASFDRAHKLAPDAAWALNNLCYVALMGGDEAAALARCSAALDREPGLSAARNNLAILHASVGRLDRAREVLLSAGDRRSGLYNMGILLLARQDYAAAAENFSEACREVPPASRSPLPLEDDACRRATEARTLARSRMRSPL